MSQENSSKQKPSPIFGNLNSSDRQYPISMQQKEEPGLFGSAQKFLRPKPFEENKIEEIKQDKNDNRKNNPLKEATGGFYLGNQLEPDSVLFLNHGSGIEFPQPKPSSLEKISVLLTIVGIIFGLFTMFMISDSASGGSSSSTVVTCASIFAVCLLIAIVLALIVSRNKKEIF